MAIFAQPIHKRYGQPAPSRHRHGKNYLVKRSSCPTAQVRLFEWASLNGRGEYLLDSYFFGFRVFDACATPSTGKILSDEIEVRIFQQKKLQDRRHVALQKFRLFNCHKCLSLVCARYVIRYYQFAHVLPERYV